MLLASLYEISVNEEVGCKVSVAVKVSKIACVCAPVGRVLCCINVCMQKG